MGVGVGVGVGAGAGVGICLELEPEPKISEMGGSGNNVFFMIKFQCFFYNFQIYLNNMGWIWIRLRMLCECFVCECYSSVVLVLCGWCVGVV